MIMLAFAVGLVSFLIPTAIAGAATTPASSAGPCTPTNWQHLKVYDANDPTMVDKNVCCPPGSEGSGTDCVFAKYINPIVKLLSVAAGIAVVIGIVIGGIQYSSSAGDPQKASQAKGKITKALLGLATFLFLYSALQFFSPGGISSAPMPDTSRGGSIANQCSKEFLGLKPWFAYLPNDAFESSSSCSITNFSFLGEQDSQGNTTKPSSLLPVLLAIADDLLRIAGLVAVAFVITGGIQYVMSSGEPDKTKKARETIINALVGVVVAIIAASVVSYIGSKLSS